MSVKVCPECGAEYIASVTRCSDCDVELATSDTDEMAAEVSEAAAEAEDRDAADLSGDELADEPTGDQIAYELDEWDNRSRILLDQLLAGQGILHVWETSTLVIRVEDEEVVDGLVDQVEAANQPTLDPDKDQVVYELAGWPEEKRTALTDSLDQAELAHGFDDNDDLVVHEEDGERIEAVLDQVDYNFSLDADDVAGDGDGAAADDDGEDGLAAQEAMSALFIAADRLMHDADDSGGVLGVGDAAGRVETMVVPYGFAPGVWEEIVERSVALRDLLDADDADDDSVIEQARELRVLLRQYV